MSDSRKVRFAKMKLIGQAKLLWTKIEIQVERTGGEPIVLWAEMKEILKEKYVFLPYQQCLLVKWQALHQESMLVTEYIAKLKNSYCNVM